MEIKSWWTKKNTGETTLTTEATMIQTVIGYDLIDRMRAEIVGKIAESFLKENADQIRKEVLKNPKFATAVYNAIVLKKAQDLL